MQFKEFQQNLENNPEYPKRLEKWKEMEESFEEEEFKETQGKIEEKIKELVVGLNLIGINTRYSCEGDFEGVGRALAREHTDEHGRRFLEEIEDPPLEGCWRNPYVGFSLDIYPGLTTDKKDRKRRERKKDKTLKSIQLLIDEFYKDHEEIPEIRIRLKEEPTRFTNYEIIASDSKNSKSVSGKEDHAWLKQKALKNLGNAQKEIHNFGKFIKEKYLEEGFHIDSLMRMKEIKRTIVSALIFSKDGKLLMGKKDPAEGGVYPDCWHIIGGGIDEGEDLEQALKREVEEEVGIDISPYHPVFIPEKGRGVAEKTLSSGEKVLCKMEFNRFRVDINDKSANEIKINLSDDLVEIRWFGPEELPSVKQIPGGREFFKKIGLIPRGK